MIRRPVTAAAAAALSVAVLTGCGVAQGNQTYKPRTPYDSSSASAGDISVRNLHVEAAAESMHAKGGSARVLGTFVNEGQAPDALVGASSDAATATSVTVDGKPATAVLVPAQGRSAAGVAIVLDDLTRDLQPGRFLTVTLTFARAGRVEVSIPVRAGDNGLAERERLHVEHPE